MNYHLTQFSMGYDGHRKYFHNKMGELSPTRPRNMLCFNVEIPRNRNTKEVLRTNILAKWQRINHTLEKGVILSLVKID